MLAKKARLTRKEFDHFFTVGKRLHSPFFQIIYAESTAPHGSTVAGKKIAKRAVDRNTLRRRMYGVLYPRLCAAKKPHTVIVIAKAGAYALPRKQFALELSTLLDRILST